MAAILKTPLENFQENYWRHRLAFDAAALDPPAYWTNVAQHALSQDEIDELQEIDSESWSHADPVMPEWAEQVRAAGFRTALLSNMPVPVRDHILRCPWLPQFDHITFSCDLRRTKPSPEIYENSLAGLGVAPSEALLLDDRVENIRAAEALGLHGILFTTPEELAPELERRFDLGVPLVVTVKRGDEKNQ